LWYAGLLWGAELYPSTVPERCHTCPGARAKRLCRLSPPYVLPPLSLLEGRGEAERLQSEQATKVEGMASRTILYIEPSVHTRRLVRKALQRRGYDVIETDDSTRGWQLLRKVEPCLVLLAVSPPDMEELEFVSRIRDDSELSNTSVIAVTTSQMRSDRERLLAAGCDDYVSKPIQVIELLNKIAIHSANVDKRVRHILVVDDEENVALTLQAGLDILPDCEVSVATGGEKAWELCQEQSFDLLVTDYRMPDLDGVALAERIQDTYPDTLVIMVTAYGDETLLERAARASVYQVLDKPVSFAEIRHAARDALEKQREARGTDQNQRRRQNPL
jgi:CheY-like chemotaxis protein